MAPAAAAALVIVVVIVVAIAITVAVTIVVVFVVVIVIVIAPVSVPVAGARDGLDPLADGQVLRQAEGPRALGAGGRGGALADRARVRGFLGEEGRGEGVEAREKQRVFFFLLLLLRSSSLPPLVGGGRRRVERRAVGLARPQLDEGAVLEAGALAEGRRPYICTLSAALSNGRKIRVFVNSTKGRWT